MASTQHIEHAATLDGALEKAARAFRGRFDAEPDVAVRAPGRVNLIGEHTDYNEGFVLPIAIDLAAVMVGRRTDGPRCRLVAADLDGALETFTADASLQPGGPQWSNYIKGVVRHFIDHGLAVPPFDAALSSTVPLGSGLSSSAALEVAAATLLETLTGVRLDPDRKALWAQKAEHTFAGTPCGIMDQMASVRGKRGAAVLLDCRTLETRLVPLDDPSVAIVVSNTNVKHNLSTGEYGIRRKQCEQALQVMRRTNHNLAALRDATPAHLDEYRNAMDELLYRRARHVVTENERTLRMVDALTQRDYPLAGRLMNESHRSLRLDYEVSCPELDVMAELAQCFCGVYGSRMTGGGFGGCTVTLVQADRADALIEHLAAEYPRRTKLPATCFRVSPADGAGVIELP